MIMRRLTVKCTVFFCADFQKLPALRKEAEKGVGGLGGLPLQ